MTQVDRNDEDKWLGNSLRFKGSFARAENTKITSTEIRQNQTVLNLVRNLMTGTAQPFMPLPTQATDLPRLSAKASGTLSNRVLTQIAQGVLPGSQSRGVVSVGAFTTTTGEFYDRLMTAMESAYKPQTETKIKTETGEKIVISPAVKFGEIKNETTVLKNAMATALGANNFAQLEQAQAREELVQNLKPVFTHMREWIAEHLDWAGEQQKDYAADPAREPHHGKQLLVWAQMERVMKPVEAQLIHAVREGALDEAAVYYFGKLADEREKALPGLMVWCAPIEGILHAAQTVIGANLERSPKSRELLNAAATLSIARQGCKDAEALEPENYPKKLVQAPLDHNWAGPLQQRLSLHRYDA